MERCITCHKRVLVALTDRGRYLPVQVRTAPSGPLVLYRTWTRGPFRVRYLHGAQGPLRAGERRVAAHWDVSPACKPPRNHSREEVALDG